MNWYFLDRTPWQSDVQLLLGGQHRLRIIGSLDPTGESSESSDDMMSCLSHQIVKSGEHHKIQKLFGLRMSEL